MRRGWRIGRGGATAVEFAIVAGVFLPLSLAVIEAGLLLWTKGTLQSAASQVARCAAIGSPNCSSVSSFAVTQAGNWIFPGIISTSNVTVTSSVCVSHTLFSKITISCPYWAGSVLPAPLNGLTLSATAYFPSSATAC